MAVYILDGGVGVGKTTLGLSIQRYLNGHGVNTVFLQEYVHNKLLKVYLDDKQRYAFTYQLLMLHKRLHIYQQAQDLARQGIMVFVDRSLEGDMAFFELLRDGGYITPMEAELYYDTAKDEMACTQGVVNVLLAARCDTALARVKVRARGGESGYDLDYLTKLETYYNKLVHPSVTVDWNGEHVVDSEGFLEEAVVASFLATLGITV